MGPFEETAISKVVMGCAETTGASIQRAMMVDLIGLKMSVEVTLIKLPRALLGPRWWCERRQLTQMGSAPSAAQ